MHRIPRSRSVLMLAAVGAISAATTFATLPATEAGMASHNSLRRLNLVAGGMIGTCGWPSAG